jgi:hypothetical protein
MREHEKSEHAPFYIEVFTKPDTDSEWKNNKFFYYLCDLLLPPLLYFSFLLILFFNKNILSIIRTIIPMNDKNGAAIAISPRAVLTFKSKSF